SGVSSSRRPVGSWSSRPDPSDPAGPPAGEFRRFVSIHVIPVTISETRRVRTMHHALRRLKRFLVLLQTGWSIVGITLIVLILTEAGFRAAFALKDWLGTEPRPDRRVLVEGYHG